jgi:hypothetical protein
VDGAKVVLSKGLNIHNESTAALGLKRTLCSFKRSKMVGRKIGKMR